MPRKRCKTRTRKGYKASGKKSTALPKYKQMIQECKDCLLTGTLLAIDPSTGSRSSMPGYALFKNGQLVESGTITVDIKGNRAERLHEINRTLREELETPDVVAVESAGYFVGKMNPASIISLQRAIGAIVAAHPVKCLIEIPSNVWQKHAFPGYIKNDANDAICIGLCAINTAKELSC